MRDWLRKLGLERYEQVFRENDVVARVLPELTDADLKELGLTLGHRRLLLKAIQGLEETGALPGADADTPAPALPPRSSIAERRQLTVMFVDLVGSTELSTRLDPEDMGRVIRAYQERCAGVVRRWDGHVAKYMGDGVLVYFGYPKAHEDDAERAVRAGLGLTAAIGGLTAGDGARLAARVGIATGLVMVGDLVGEAEAQERAVVGETPNLAARLQALAEPGAVVIAPGTRRLVGGLFEVADLGGHTIKGFAEPVQAWRVTGESRAESRFEALHVTGLMSLVGREHEIALLLDRFERARDGEGQVVLLSGEPGIGKSRITQSLRARLAEHPQTRLGYFCSPFHVNSALHPVLDQLARAAGFALDDTAEAKLDKLEAVLAQGAERTREAIALLAQALAIPTGDRYPPLKLTPQKQRQRTFEVLVEQLAALAAHEPVLMILEDAHWIDPSTQELFGLVIERVARLPVLLVITFRPEFTPPWLAHAHVTQLSLNRLSQRQGAALVERVTGGKALPDAVREQIVAKTDGVPLFVEELTKAVLESGLLRDAGVRYELAGAFPALAIPATLHDSLMARLDRLAPVKEVAQTGAVIGRVFSHELLAAVSSLSAAGLGSALDSLVSAELIFRRGAAPDATYSFKHALVQDAAYQSLLRSRRQQLHSHIAQALEERFPETADAEPELLAHHLTEAGQAGRAVDYWSKAGRRALERSAYAEAIAHTGVGLELLTTLAGGAERELELRNSQAQALLATQGWAAPETGAAFVKARQLCRELGNPSLTFPVLRGLHNFHFVRGEHGVALDIGHECLDLAEKQNDGAAVILAHRLIGQALFYSGELTAGRQHLERAIALYDPRRHRASAAIYGMDSKLAALAWLSQLLWLVGYPDRACRAADEALADAARREGRYDLANSMFHALFIRLLRRDHRAVLHGAERLLALAREDGIDVFVLSAEGHSYQARLAVSRRGEDIAPFAEYIHSWRAGGAEIRMPISLGVLAQALAVDGRVEEALATIAEALEMTDRNGERWSEAELHRLKGEILRVQDGSDAPGEAEVSFRRSLDIAREQSAKSWELRAATSLARLWRDQGRRRDARDLLAPVYEWFTEGFDTADLKDAKTLLGELK